MASSSFPPVERRSLPELEWVRPSRPRTSTAPPPPPPPPRRGRRGYVRFAFGVAAGLGLSVVFGASLAVALLVHLDLPPTRRVLAAFAGDAASKALGGRVEIVSLDHVSTRAVDVGEIRVRAEAGNRVLSAYGTHLRFELFGIARSLLEERTPTLDRVVVERIDVALTPDAPSAPEPKVEHRAEKTRSTLRLAIASIDVRRLSAFGVAGGHVVDVGAELENASILVAPDATLVSLPRLTIESAPIAGVLPATTKVSIAGRLRVPSSVDPGELPVVVEDAFAAIDSNGAHLGLSGQTNARTWSLSVEVPPIAPETIGRFIEGRAPVAAPIALALEATGDLEHASVRGTAAIGGSSVGIEGAIDLGALGSEPSERLARVELGTVSLALRDVEARMFAPSAPPLVVSADVHAHAAKTTRGTEVVIDSRGDTAAFGRTGTLALDLRALVDRRGRLDGAGGAHVTVGPSSADATFSVAQTTGMAHATVTAHLPSLEQLRPWTRQPLGGRMELTATADLDLRARTIAASGSAHASGLRYPSLSLPDGVLALQVEGPLTTPRFASSFAAREVTIAHTRFHAVDAEATGTPSLVATRLSLGTDAAQQITVATHVRPTAGGAVFIGTHATLRRDRFAADLGVKELALDRGTVRVDGLRLASTAGGLRLDAAFDPRRHRLSLHARSTPLDLAALAHGFAVESRELSGHLAIDADLATIDVDRARLVHGDESGILGIDPDEPPNRAVAPHATAPYVTGHLRLDLEDGVLPEVSGVAAHIDVDVEDRLVVGDVALTLQDLARIGLHGTALVPGRLDDWRSFRDVVGRVELDVPRIDLAQLSAALAKRGNAAPALAGTAKLEGHLERHDPKAPPSGELKLETQGFAMASGGTRLEGIDARARLAMETGDEADLPTRVFGVLELHDPKGPLAFASVGTTGTWSDLLSAHRADLPIALDLIVPPRELEAWPRSIASKVPLHGMVAMAAKAEGTLGAPKLDLRARLGGLTALDGSLHDADLRLEYDGVAAIVKAFVSPRHDPKRSELLLTADIALPATALLAGEKTWSARLDARLDGLPLDLFATNTSIKGALRGELHVDHLHDPNAEAARARVDGRIDVDGLAIGDARFEESFVTVKIDERTATAAVALHGTDGRIDAHATVPLTWNHALPSVAPDASIDAGLDAAGLRLRIAEPFVTEVDALDGRIDGRVVAHLTKNASGQWSGTPEGELHLREGTVVADAVGERWEHVRADVKLEKGRVDLTGLELHGSAGGDAKLHGSMTLAGFAPKTLHAEIETKRFPIASEGARVGDLTGKITLDGKSVPNGDGRDRMEVVARLDDLAVDLSGEAGKRVQSLDQDPTIVVLQPITAPAAPPTPRGQGTPIVVKVDLPHPVWVRREDLRIALSGDPTVTIDGPLRLSGELRIVGNPGSRLQQRSWIEVLGKHFYLQPSRIAFEDTEELDPRLDVEARWQAPDRSIVQVKVTGRLSTPKVEFKALDEGGAPLGLTQGEVMSLLVLGRRDAGSAQQQAQAERGAATQAAALVSGMTGSIVGRQIQKMLPASMTVSLAPGKYSSGFQHDNVYFEVGYNTSGSQIGPQLIGQTTPRTTFLVDWRFARKWSLITTLGDTGSALVDLLWHYRY